MISVFLVVSFCVFLHSILDLAPIAFLKVGSDLMGSVDFILLSDYSEKSVNGDVNYYMGDPFEKE